MGREHWDSLSSTENEGIRSIPFSPIAQGSDVLLAERVFI